MDLATCIFAQKTILTTQSLWSIHLRADSSPQGGRDFFLSEHDVVQMQGSLSHKHIRVLFKEGQLCIKNRLLPASILGQRASSAVHKAQQLLHSLSMESENLAFSVGRTFSLLTDFGAEGGMFNMPRSSLDAVVQEKGGSVAAAPVVMDLDCEGQIVGASLGLPPLDSAFSRLFCKAMPIADCDHSIHHATGRV